MDTEEDKQERVSRFIEKKRQALYNQKWPNCPEAEFEKLFAWLLAHGAYFGPILSEGGDALRDNHDPALLSQLETQEKAGALSDDQSETTQTGWNSFYPRNKAKIQERTDALLEIAPTLAIVVPFLEKMTMDILRTSSRSPPLDGLLTTSDGLVYLIVNLDNVPQEKEAIVDNLWRNCLSTGIEATREFLTGQQHPTEDFEKVATWLHFQLPYFHSMIVELLHIVKQRGVPTQDACFTLLENVYSAHGAKIEEKTDALLEIAPHLPAVLKLRDEVKEHPFPFGCELRLLTLSETIHGLAYLILSLKSVSPQKKEVIDALQDDCKGIFKSWFEGERGPKDDLRATLLAFACLAGVEDKKAGAAKLMGAQHVRLRLNFNHPNAASHT